MKKRVEVSRIWNFEAYRDGLFIKEKICCIEKLLFIKSLGVIELKI